MRGIRGRELYIIAGVIAAVVIAAWWFLFFSPLRTKMAKLDSDYAARQSQLLTLNATVQRLTALQKTAPQAKGDLVRLNKLLPAEAGIPSLIVSLTQTTKASGLKWTSVQPAEIVPNTPFSVQPIDLGFSGRYFDLEDFLYRLENYVDYRNQDFQVSGRMFQVQKLDIALGDVPPAVIVTMTVNGFLWTPSAVTPASTTP